jgi:multidrug efflux pump subunit AcrA (membrane-fusion protein)
MKTKIIIIFLAALVMAGCAHDHGQEAEEYDHDHDENIQDESANIHDERLQLAAYSDDFEVFAEAAPFVAGQTSDISARISLLKNFKPLENGSVAASLIAGANNIRQTLERPVRPGVYQFSLRPDTAGTGRLEFDIKTPEGTSKIVIPGVTVYANEHDAYEAAAAEAASGNGAVFTKEQSWKVDFATDKARSEPFGQIIRATAQIQPSQGDELVIATKAGGVVFFLDGNMMEGKAVSAKQALFSTDGSGMADNDFLLRHAEAESGINRAKAEINRARAGLDRARAVLSRTRAEYARKQELAKEYIVTQSDLVNAGMDLANAEADFAGAETDLANAETDLANAEAVYNNSLRNNFATGKYVVNSPANGFVTRVLARNGEYAEAGQPILVISQNRDLFIKAELQPRHFDILNRITSANIRLLNSDDTYTLEELGGRLISRGKVTDIANPLIPVLFQVNNRAGLPPGGFVEMFIKTQTSAQAITVPNEAIIEEMGAYFTYVQITPELFEKRAIKKGATDGIRTEITEGVSAGDRVVSKGAMLVKLAQASGALDPHAGHAH